LASLIDIELFVQMIYILFGLNSTPQVRYILFFRYHLNFIFFNLTIENKIKLGATCW